MTPADLTPHLSPRLSAVSYLSLGDRAAAAGVLSRRSDPASLRLAARLWAQAGDVTQARAPGPALPTLQLYARRLAGRSGRGPRCSCCVGEWVRTLGSGVGMLIADWCGVVVFETVR